MFAQFCKSTRNNWASGQDGGIGRHDLPLLTTTSKLQLKYRATITQECRNQGEWKSDKYRIKETISIHTGTRGAGARWAGSTPTGRKIRKGYLGSEESQMHTRPPSPGFQGQEDKCPQLLVATPSRDWDSERNCCCPKQFLLKNPYTESPA